MEPPRLSPRPCARSPFAAALLLALVTGCASPGPPRPPSLNIPETVRDLRADRRGNVVDLHWTTPSQSTDHQPLRSGLSAEICTEVFRSPPPPPPKPAGTNAATPPGHHQPHSFHTPSTAALGASPPIAATPSSPSPTLPDPTLPDPTLPGPAAANPASGTATAAAAARPSACNPTVVLATRPGAIATATLPLPPDLLSGPSVLLGVRIAIRSERAGRLGDPSAPAFAPTGPAPIPVAGLHAAPSDRGLRLTWQPAPAPGVVVELTRHTLATPKPVRLADPAPGDTAGGLLDTSAERGLTYTYSATRLVRKSVLGRPVVLASTPSAEVQARFVDLQPPAPPTNLLAIPTPTSVDLSWEPNAEPDLAGYLVFRAPAAQARELARPDATAGPGLPSPPWVRLTPDLLPAPAFRDLAAPAGAFVYRVVAVDRSGNQGAPDAPVRVDTAAP